MDDLSHLPAQPALSEFTERSCFETYGRLASVNRIASIYGSFGDRDTQTGLRNRKAFHTALAALPSDWRCHTALLLLDIDNLRIVNARHGRAEGDAVVAELSDTLRKLFGDEAVYRTGTDEFSVLLGKCDSTTGMDAAAASIYDRLRPKDCCVEGRGMINVTIGGALASPFDADADALLLNADIALCSAKEFRRGAYEAFCPPMKERARSKTEGISAIAIAIDDGRVLPFYQPLIDLASMQVIGVEALVRLQTKDKQVLGADEFAAAFEHPSLALRVTDEMLRAVARDVGNWIAAGIGFRHVGINLTAWDLSDPSLEQRLRDAFGAAGVSLQHVVIEITEMVYLDDRTNAIAETIRRLRRNGILVALDDFGTGFASLTHLLSLPVDIIKIDRSFVQRLLHDKPSQAIVKGIIGIAKDIGMRVVAEGIEGFEEAQLLRALGANIGQGYLFSPPVDVERMNAMLRNFGPRQKAIALTKYGMPAGVC